jgi:hypothetical protein
MEDSPLADMVSTLGANKDVVLTYLSNKTYVLDCKSLILTIKYVT